MTEQKNKNRKRTLSRLIAVQVMYQFFFNSQKKSCEEIKNELVQNYSFDHEDEISSYEEKIDADLLNKLIASIHLFEQIDQEITPFVQQSVSKLDSLVLQILRLAVFEMKTLQESPPKVIIDEYVGIASSFFEFKKVTFVNAILDKFK